MEKVDWKVEGMTCTNCALTINRYLEKEGLKDVNVNFIGGEVSFELNGNKSKEEITKGIADLGYKVINEQQTTKILLQSLTTFPILSAFYFGIDAAHDALAYSFSDEPLDSIGNMHSGVYSWYELFWSECS